MDTGHKVVPKDAWHIEAAMNAASRKDAAHRDAVILGDLVLKWPIVVTAADASTLEASHSDAADEMPVIALHDQKVAWLTVDHRNHIAQVMVPLQDAMVIEVPHATFIIRDHEVSVVLRWLTVDLARNSEEVCRVVLNTVDRKDADRA